MSQFSAMRLAFALLGLAALASAHDFPTEDDVLVLTDENFDDALKEFDTLLVEFYAPWCGHCKRLAPEYAKAAAELKEKDLFIAKVDATEEEEVAGRFGIRGFPTLKFFRGGKESEYEGGRTASDIVKFVVKKSGPPTVALENKEAVQAYIDGSDVVAVGFFEDAGSDGAKAFTAAAMGNDDVVFGVVSDAAVAAEFELTGVTVFKKFDEGRANFEGDMTEEALAEFVAANALPNVITFSPETARKIFAPDQPIKNQLLLFADEGADGFDDVMAGFQALAAEKKGSALFVFIKASEDRVLSYFGFSKDDLPTSVIVKMSDSGMKKYQNPEDTVSQEGLTSFLGAYLDGNLKPWLKTEDAPESNDEPVTVIVGKTFEDIVLDETKDVMVEFYAPWCGHCKALAPKYDELGEMFEDVSSVVIAKMDATANEVDHPGVNVQGFPTILFFPANAKDSPIDYSGPRTANGMADFIKEKAAISFSLDDDAEEEDDEEDEKDEL